MLWPLPRETDPYPLNRSLVGPKSQSGHFEDQIYLLPLPRFKPQITQLAPSHYTHWAIMADHAHTCCFCIWTWQVEAELYPDDYHSYTQWQIPYLPKHMIRIFFPNSWCKKCGNKFEWRQNTRTFYLHQWHSVLLVPIFFIIAYMVVCFVCFC
jgi:hypothetical protein